MRLLGEPLDRVIEVNKKMQELSCSLRRLFVKTGTIGTSEVPQKLFTAFEALADFVEKLSDDKGHKEAYKAEADAMRRRANNILL